MFFAIKQVMKSATESHIKRHCLHRSFKSSNPHCTLNISQAFNSLYVHSITVKALCIRLIYCALCGLIDANTGKQSHTVFFITCLDLMRKVCNFI